MSKTMAVFAGVLAAFCGAGGVLLCAVGRPALGALWGVLAVVNAISARRIWRLQ